MRREAMALVLLAFVFLRVDEVAGVQELPGIKVRTFDIERGHTEIPFQVTQRWCPPSFSTFLVSSATCLRSSAIGSGVKPAILPPMVWATPWFSVGARNG